MPKHKPGQSLVPVERIERAILLIRGHKVMLSPDLAELYQVEPRVLVQAVKRNLDRFPTDFMSQLSESEFKNLKSQFVISSWGGARRARPYAFTKQGVAMLSSVLRSERAVQVNIAIMRAFVRLRQLMASHTELARRLAVVEKNIGKHAVLIAKILDKLTTPPESERRPIGFRLPNKTLTREWTKSYLTGLPNRLHNSFALDR